MDYSKPAYISINSPLGYVQNLKDLNSLRTDADAAGGANLVLPPPKKRFYSNVSVSKANEVDVKKQKIATATPGSQFSVSTQLHPSSHTERNAGSSFAGVGVLEQRFILPLDAASPPKILLPGAGYISRVYVPGTILDLRNVVRSTSNDTASALFEGRNVDASGTVSQVQLSQQSNNAWQSVFNKYNIAQRQEQMSVSASRDDAGQSAQDHQNDVRRARVESCDRLLSKARCVDNKPRQPTGSMLMGLQQAGRQTTPRDKAHHSGARCSGGVRAKSPVSDEKIQEILSQVRQQYRQEKEIAQVGSKSCKLLSQKPSVAASYMQRNEGGTVSSVGGTARVAQKPQNSMQGISRNPQAMNQGMKMPQASFTASVFLPEPVVYLHKLSCGKPDSEAHSNKKCDSVNKAHKKAISLKLAGCVEVDDDYAPARWAQSATGQSSAALSYQAAFLNNFCRNYDSLCNAEPANDVVAARPTSNVDSRIPRTVEQNGLVRSRFSGYTVADIMSDNKQVLGKLGSSSRPSLLVSSDKANCCLNSVRGGDVTRVSPSTLSSPKLLLNDFDSLRANAPPERVVAECGSVGQRCELLSSLKQSKTDALGRRANEAAGIISCVTPPCSTSSKSGAGFTKSRAESGSGMSSSSALSGCGAAFESRISQVQLECKRKFNALEKRIATNKVQKCQSPSVCEKVKAARNTKSAKSGPNAVLKHDVSDTPAVGRKAEKSDAAGVVKKRGRPPGTSPTRMKKQKVSAVAAACLIAVDFATRMKHKQKSELGESIDETVEGRKSARREKVCTDEVSAVLCRRSKDFESVKKMRERKLLRMNDNRSPSVILEAKQLTRAVGATTWVQDVPCLDLRGGEWLHCRECRSLSSGEEHQNIVCRFQAFRRLTVIKMYRGQAVHKSEVMREGFSTSADADVDDVALWMPGVGGGEETGEGTGRLSSDEARSILTDIGDRFCRLVEQEMEALSWVSSEVLAWKRPLYRVREMCDICSTTIFNVHWICSKCGYAVCPDCYRLFVDASVSDTDTRKMAYCTVARLTHEPRFLVITQTIPYDALEALCYEMHEVRKVWRIGEACSCDTGQVVAREHDAQLSDAGKRSIASPSVSLSLDCAVSQSTMCDREMKKDPVASGGLHMLAGVYDYVHEESDCTHASNELATFSSYLDSKHSSLPCTSITTDFPGRISLPILKQELHLLSDKQCFQEKDAKDAVPSTKCNSRSGSVSSSKGGPAGRSVGGEGGVGKLVWGKGRIPQYDVELTSMQFPLVPHDWLDEGRLLLLTDPQCAANMALFKQQWRRGQPVLVSNCQHRLQTKIWTPEAFSAEFGHLTNDLVDCANKGTVLMGHRMSEFWQGFECMGERMLDSAGRPMILKLKDWPPKADFSDLMPERFQDLLQALPLPEYTHRDGVFNLVSCLPDFFLRPDLGPKMYNAYGSALHPQVGSTNLHLDISDAINLILYVGVPVDDRANHEAGALRSMCEAGCCERQLARVLSGAAKPGALWHIFDPQDANKIRDMLNKVAVENGEPVEEQADPIHDQSFYLDEALRSRLLREYNVQGYTFVQCLGDAIFIPAGAPHQVRNLHSCIKAAEDFVSPENLSVCFNLTEEFRRLGDTHSNHEDKLQVKNIIYHAVKDAVTALSIQKQEPVNNTNF